MEKKEAYRKYAFMAVLVGLFYLSYLMVRPFMNAALSAAVFAFLFYPAYKNLLNIVKKKWIASLLVVLLIILIILIPIMFSGVLVNEVTDVYKTVKDIDVHKITMPVSDFVGNDINVAIQLKNFTDKVFVYVIGRASEFAISIPQKFVGFFVFIALLYFFFKDGDKIKDFIKNFMPVEEKDKEKIIKDVGSISASVVYGFFLTGLIAGVIGGFGFYIFGIKNPILWGLVMVIFTILPMVGTSLIWIPAVLYKFYLGEWWIGLGLLAYSFILLGSIENFLRPKLIGSKSDIHPAVVLLGVLGGLYTIGIIGIIVGPIILGTLLTFLNIHKR